MENDLSKKLVIKALQSPYKLLVDYLLSYVSLTDIEKKCIDFCIRSNLTEERTAEQLGFSRDYIAKHKKSAIKKCQKAFTSCEILVKTLANTFLR